MEATFSKGLFVLIAAASMAGCASNIGAPGPSNGIVLKDMGSFHVGGREVRLSGKPVNSQGGPFAYRVAQARPDKVKALVLVEPAGIGDPAQAAALMSTPNVSLYGDFIVQDARWPTIKANNLKFQDAIRAAGGKPEVIDLPALGIMGNSHMLMMDRNNLEVAALIQRWLVGQGLTK